MKKLLLSLCLSLILISNLAYADTTNNLVSQDFTTGWTNTGNTYHGSNTIAGHHDGTVESNSVSLNSLDINKESLNQGFSVTGSAEVWFWNNQTQSVTQTIKAVDDNGQIITQNRTLSGTCATWNGCSFGSMTDTLIIGSNSQQDYNVNLKYSFDVPGTSSAGHLGADLRNPSLTVDYTYVSPLDNATQTALLDLNNDIKDDLKDIDNFSFKEEIIMDTKSLEEPPLEILSYSDGAMFEMYKAPTMKEEIKKEETIGFTEKGSKEEPFETFVQEKENLQGPKTVEEEPSSLRAERSLNEEEDTSTQTSTEEEQKTEAAADSKNNVSGEKKAISLVKTMEKIDAQVKDIGKNLQIKNLVKINAMVDNSILLGYNKPFYKELKIYERQIDIQDNRVIYTANLETYTRADPIFVQRSKIMDIRLQKKKLRQELEVLKNG